MSKRTNTVMLIIVTSIISSTITYFAFIPSKTSTNTVPKKEILSSNSCAYKIGRLRGFQYIKPLEYAEPECETSKYSGLKGELLNIIDYYKNSGSINSASVYLRDFDKGEWMNINPNESYHPGSLMKLPALITILKMEENNRGFLNKKITYSKKSNFIPNQTFNSKQIEFGKSYTIKELLEYMISYSNNNATNLLHGCLDLEEYKKMYSYLGLTVPDIHDRNFSITAKDYSTFFKILFNAGYLNFEHSEYAMEILSKCDFEKGFASGLPPGTPLAHKFGEWGDSKSTHQLHESGLIYLNGTAYLLTVMTDGTDVQRLPEIMNNISKKVFDNLNDPTIPNTLFQLDKQLSSL